jgi:hypothetical protein
MPLFGLPDVDELEAKRDVKGLFQAVGHEKDRDVREGDSRALGIVGGTSAGEPVTAASKDASAARLGVAARWIAYERVCHADRRMRPRRERSPGGTRRRSATGAPIALDRAGTLSDHESVFGLLCGSTRGTD